MHEDIPILNFMVPKAFTHDNGKLTGVTFEKVKAEYDAKGRRNLVPTGEPDQHYRLRRRAGRGRPGKRLPLDRARLRHRVRQVGHAEGRSEDHGLDQSEGVLRRRRRVRPEEHHLGGGARPRGRAVDRQALAGRGHRTSARCPQCTSLSQKMGIHEWSYDNDDLRSTSATGCRIATRWSRCKDIKRRGRARLSTSSSRSSEAAALPELRRADRVHRARCASSATPASTSARWTASPSRQNGDEADLRHAPEGARAATSTQDLYVADGLKTGRIMVKDEDVCLHCGLCAERCPTGAWDMQKYLIDMTHAGTPCQQKPISSVNDFVVRFANVNGSGSASANELFARSILRMGVPVVAAQHLPVQHPGPADLVRGARLRGRPSRRPRRRRPDGGDEPADLGQGRRRRSSPAAICSTIPPSRCRRRNSATTST